MLCADVSHKIMRADTVYDYMNELYQHCGSSSEFHDTAVKTLVGEIVLTRYCCGCFCGALTGLKISAFCILCRGLQPRDFSLKLIQCFSECVCVCAYFKCELFIKLL